MVLLATPKHTIDRASLEHQLQLYVQLAAEVEIDHAWSLPNLSAPAMVDYALDAGTILAETDDYGELIRYDGARSALQAWYRNNVLHAFVVPSLIACVLLAYGKADADWLRQRCSWLVTLLDGEFFLGLQPPHPRNELKVDPARAAEHRAQIERYVERWLDVLIASGIVLRDGDYLAPPDLSAPQFDSASLLAKIVEPTLERYFIAATVVRHLPQIDGLRSLADACEGLARRVTQLRSLDAPEFFDHRQFLAFFERLVEEGWLREEVGGEWRVHPGIAIAMRDAIPLFDATFRHAVRDLQHRLAEVQAPVVAE